MAGFNCPSPTCEFSIEIGFGTDQGLLILAQREEGDTRFNIYMGAQLSDLQLVHTCGDDEGPGDAGDREPRDPHPPEQYMKTVL